MKQAFIKQLIIVLTIEFKVRRTLSHTTIDQSFSKSGGFVSMWIARKSEFV
jgi:hypothetical protein